MDEKTQQGSNTQPSGGLNPKNRFQVHSLGIGYTEERIFCVDLCSMEFMGCGCLAGGISETDPSVVRAAFDSRNMSSLHR